MKLSATGLTTCRQASRGLQIYLVGPAPCWGAELPAVPVPSQVPAEKAGLQQRLVPIGREKQQGTPIPKSARTCESAWGVLIQCNT